MANNKKPEHDSEGRVCCRCLSYLKWNGFTRDSRWFIWHKSHCKFCEQIARSKKNYPLILQNSKTWEKTALYMNWDKICESQYKTVQEAINHFDEGYAKWNNDLLYDKTSVFIQWFIAWFMFASLLYLIVVSISI